LRDDTKEEYNASETVNDRKRWLEQFIHLMGHTGNYTREEAIAARQGGHASGRAKFQSFETGKVSERPGLH
jgi:hypothetical protein